MQRFLPSLPLLLLAGLAGCDSARAAGEADGGIPPRELRALGGTVVFVSERDGQAEVYAVPPAGGKARRLTEAPSQDYPAAPLPDGSAVLAVSVTGQEQAQQERLVLLPLDGGAARTLGPVSARVRSPAWAPDGSWLVFESDSASFRDLYRINADGSGLVRLTDDPQGNFEPAVSPDGRWIAFASSRDGDAEIYVMRADGGEPRRLTAFHRDDWAPAWSPDGATLAFLSSREGADRVFLVDADGTDVRRLDVAAADTSLAEADPAWSPDGRRIALVVRDRAGGARLAVAEVGSGAWSYVTGEDERASQPAWSPDGRHLAYVAERGGDADLRIVRADGTASAPLVRSPGPDWLPRWIP